MYDPATVYRDSTIYQNRVLSLVICLRCSTYDIFAWTHVSESWHVMRHTRVIVIPITSREYRSVRDTFRAIVESSIKRHEWYVYGTETTIYSYTYRIQRTINFSFFMRTKRNIELAYVLNRYVLPARFYLFPPPNVLSFYSFHVQIRRRERSMFRER